MNKYHKPPHPLANLVSRMREINDSMNALQAALRTESVCSATHAAAEARIQNLVAESVSPNRGAAHKRSFSELLAAKRSAAQSRQLDQEAALNLDISMDSIPTDVSGEDDLPALDAADCAMGGIVASARHESFALGVPLNERQLMASEMALSGKDYVLIGPAGSGKTTTQRAVAESLLQSKRLRTSKFKVQANGDGPRQYITAPSIAFCAYTRRAASNLAKAILKSPLLQCELPGNIMTIHALLEYEPEMYMDVEDGETKEKFRFAPKRTANNPLDITHLVIEESSMVGLDLWANLYDALPPDCQIIFIGDINQLPPVFGPSILNYALTQLPIIELVETYRNQGIVLENAHNILAGKPIREDKDFVVVRSKSNVQVGQTKMSMALGAIFKKLSEATGTDGLLEYDPEDCVILSPWNKNDLGTHNINNWIAQFLGEKRQAVVFEVLAGFNKHYLAVGDKVMFNKRDAVIHDIHRNPMYHGKEPQLPGKDLSRFGVRSMGRGDLGETSLEEMFPDYSNFSLESLENEKAERKQQSSHVVHITYDDGSAYEISAAGDFGPQVFSLGYALTVHKAQGSEWRKVFIILHKDFNNMLYRELFYTAVTRARTKVTIIAHDTVIAKAIASQRIKGDTLKDKLEFFNGGADMRPGVYASIRNKGLRHV